MAKRTQQSNNQRTVHVGVGLLLLLGAYLIGSWAVNTGELWMYVVTFAALVLSVRYFGEALTKKQHGKTSRQPKKA